MKLVEFLCIHGGVTESQVCFFSIKIKEAETDSKQ